MTFEKSPKNKNVATDSRLTRGMGAVFADSMNGSWNSRRYGIVGKVLGYNRASADDASLPNANSIEHNHPCT